jgi:hypothetical protein
MGERASKGNFFPTGLTKGARRSDLITEAVRTYGFLPPSEETHRGWAGMRAAMECSVEDEELNNGVAEKVEELLLLRLVPTEAREAAGNAGKQRRPWRWSAGMASPKSSGKELRSDGTLSRRLPRVYSVA